MAKVLTWQANAAKPLLARLQKAVFCAWAVPADCLLSRRSADVDHGALVCHTPPVCHWQKVHDG